MKLKYPIAALCLHAGLLLLASTRFTVVSWIVGPPAWSWDYLQYAYRSGWGYQYHSEYALAVVLTYLAAFLVGIIGYAMAGRRIAGACSAPAILLCVLGSISFLIEGSHWLWDHHLSWIAICPAASLLLAGIAIVQLAMNSEPINDAPLGTRGAVTPVR